MKAAEKKFKYAIGHLYVNEVATRDDNENDIANVKGLFQNYIALQSIKVSAFASAKRERSLNSYS